MANNSTIGNVVYAESIGIDAWQLSWENSDGDKATKNCYSENEVAKFKSNVGATKIVWVTA